MKKMIALLCSLIVVIAMVGCTSKTYELPHDQFCYSESNGSVIALDLKEKEYIIDLLNNGNWYGDIAKCPSDYKFYTKSQSIGYNTEEGVFNDFTLKKSLTISEENRVLINRYLDDSN